MLALPSTARNARSGRRAAGAHVGGPHSSRPLFTPSGSSFPFYPVHPSLFFFFSPEQIYNSGCCGGSHDASSPAVEREERGTSDLRGSPPRRMTVGAASCPRPRRAPPNRITAGVRRSLWQATHHGGTRQALHGGGRHFVLFFPPFLVMSIILALHFFPCFLFYVFFSN